MAKGKGKSSKGSKIANQAIGNPRPTSSAVTTTPAPKGK